MIRRPPRSTQQETLFPYTTLFRSTQAKIVRLGVPESGRIPVEYAALQVILNSSDPTPLLKDLIQKASPAGYFYVAAGLNSQGLTPESTEEAHSIPITVKGGNLIVLESGDALYRDYIATGQLWKTIEQATASESL